MLIRDIDREQELQIGARDRESRPINSAISREA
jgi:hypothetical protein